MSDPMWRPSGERVKASNLLKFMERVRETWGADLSTYEDLQAWSVANREEFWVSLWDDAGIVGVRGERALVDGDKMPSARFFPDATLNFAENLLRKQDGSVALTFSGEGTRGRDWTWEELYGAVSQTAQALEDLGVERGDRVAAFMPNIPEIIVSMLAAASIGAVWSSCSPDFGVRGVLDRFGQIEPKVLIACDGYRYNGKVLSSGDKLKEITAALPSLEKTIIVPFIGAPCDVPEAVQFPDLLEAYEPRDIAFAQLPFSHPLYIMFSSGTTGAPKCIVHSAGGTLLQQVKEHRLNCDLKEGDVLFYFTTCGWMMWNWLVAGLSCGARLALYDGSPFYPDGNVLFDYADDVRINVFGTSAKYIDSLNKAGLAPRGTHDLGSIRTILSTGSPLVEAGFDYVYEHIKADVALCSISGGTDIISCFVLGNPIGPVWRGEIQAKGLGMAVDVWDDQGGPVRGEKGELVCTGPFPSMPTGFWNDPDGAKYRAAYFERFDDVWCHGDFAEITSHGGIIIYGRSDATLNPGGVRIGTAEIYAQVEKLPAVKEAIAIGQDWEGDVRIILFVVLADGEELDEDLTQEIKAAIRAGASPRHVPAKVLAVSDIPRTKSGKITELAVRDVVHGREIKNKEALANPEALDFFKNRKELES